MEDRYSNREIRLMFDKIEILLNDIKKEIASTAKDLDDRVTKLETDVGNLKTFQTRAMTLWAFGVTFAGFVVNLFINRFL